MLSVNEDIFSNQELLSPRNYRKKVPPADIVGTQNDYSQCLTNTLNIRVLIRWVVCHTRVYIYCIPIICEEHQWRNDRKCFSVKPPTVRQFELNSNKQSDDVFENQLCCWSQVTLENHMLYPCPTLCCYISKENQTVRSTVSNPGLLQLAKTVNKQEVVVETNQLQVADSYSKVCLAVCDSSLVHTYSLA